MHSIPSMPSCSGIKVRKWSANGFRDPYFWKEQGRAFAASSGYPIAGPGVNHEDKLPTPDKTADSIAMADMASGKLAAPIAMLPIPNG
jgi:hypothetical protein